ncbi:MULTISPECIES: aldo/keto reductase [unclassified Pasteurella]|uniref:aldo/keto reductase n=1 Tax=unclassified Pasteurella TaxID=2621516 RepID=UPI0010730B4D|nr:aldo/keto reductase [Pasteurella sp. 19428wF3_WM03]TFU49564.1 aldo/keto reductase [Pasteurella sp. WM03]
MVNQSKRQLLKSGGLTALALGLGGTATSVVANTLNQGGLASEDKIPSQRQLGNLRVSSLGLGCQGLGQNMYAVPQPHRHHAVRLIHQAFDHGVTFFDTAEAYGPFESERVVGEGLKGIRDQVVLATKFGWDIDQKTGKRTGKLNSRPEHIKQVVDSMLQRLQTDRIDLLYQHRVDPNVAIEEVAGAIQDLMKQGKVLNWGLSEASEQTIRKAHAIQPLTAVQSEYSLFFRGREKDVIPVCEELGIGFVPWSPLAMGTLAGYVDESSRFSSDPSQDLRGIIPRFTPEAMQQNVKLIRLVQKWAKRKLCTPAQFSLAWLMAQKNFIVPIPGTTKSRHLLDNLGADDVKFSDEELAQFREELEAIDIVGLRLPEAILKFSEAK